MVFDIFSKRSTREVCDVYIYDEIGQRLRVQLVHVLRDVLSTDEYRNKLPTAAKTIHDALAREYGVFKLGDEIERIKPDYPAALFNFLLRTQDHRQVLDVVEASLRVADVLQRNYDDERPLLSIAEAVAEVNARFREHGVGYQFESGTMIKVDSTIVHQEVIKPALALLADPRYSGANEEYLRAYEHYRHGRQKECINECLKAFESTMKIICKKRKWKVDANATASRLIDVCFANSLVPAHLQSEFSALRSSLESGIPTVRNRTSGHGQGAAQTSVPDYIAEYLLHSTAATILFLTRAEAAIP